MRKLMVFSLFLVMLAFVATACSLLQEPEEASGTIVLRSDFGLQIPSVPNVANVEEEVDLHIDFVANRI